MERVKMRFRQEWHIRCEQASLAERLIGISSDKHVRQVIFLSGGGGTLGDLKMKDKISEDLSFSFFMRVVLFLVPTTVVCFEARFASDCGVAYCLVRRVLLDCASERTAPPFVLLTPLLFLTLTWDFLFGRSFLSPEVLIDVGHRRRSACLVDVEAVLGVSVGRSSSVLANGELRLREVGVEACSPFDDLGTRFVTCRRPLLPLEIRSRCLG